KRILSGMRPSGKLHLGHYLGVLVNWKSLQEENDGFYFVADWHALTTEYERTGVIGESIDDMVVDWLASGLDPSKATLFIQSHVPQHAELHLLLSMITPLSWLERNPTYKEQLREQTTRDLHTYGFLGYPVLQAADILMYDAALVPVGIDQVPHLELSREIARRFNFLYKEVFAIPQAFLTETPKIMGTDNRKMSKSYGNAILLCDTAEEVWAKVKPMVTDPARVRRTDPGNPEICNVFSYHKIFSDEETIQKVDVGCRTAGIGCIECKKWMYGHMEKVLAPIREKRKAIVEGGVPVRQILAEGTERAREIAEKKMKEVRKAIGL
ncbi:MAG TPA: tryptophan--tRNA ligase, partial [Candidatus Deferrimicrobiaceae bacterium]|nr:tryptophan--tRNA ligase [Candidatus Deferrimicrobiaceae bacterium]